MVSGSDSTHVGVTRPMNFEKNYDLFFAISCFRDFSEPSCHSSSFIDLANTALANIRPVKTICMVSGSDSTHVGVTGPMNFEKNYDLFFAKSCFRDFSEPSCHSSSFIDLAKTALANIRSVKTICMFSGSDSTHMVVTSPVNSKQPVRFFLRKSWSRNFAVPSCHPNTFIDLANTVLANRCSANTICMDSGNDSTHLDVTGPMNFEKK